MTLAYKFPTISGTASDRTGGTWTNLPQGWIFIETDTGLIYHWTGSAWVIITNKDVTETLTGKTLTSSVINTPTIKYTDVTKVTGDSPYAIPTTGDTIRANASGGALTVTLPTAVGVTGKKYTIKRIDFLTSSVLVTIATTSSQTISGAPAAYLWPGEETTVISDGANWEEINRSYMTGINSYMLKGSTANRRYPAGWIASNIGMLTSSTSPAANTLWAIPFPVPQTTKFDTISFRQTTGSTAGNSRCGIYRDSGNCYPGVLVYDTGAIVTTGAGGIDTTITAGLQVLPRGLYWLAYEQDTATGQMVIMNGTFSQWAPLAWVNGMNAAPGFAYSVAHTFGALPDPYTSSATVLNVPSAVGTPIPAIFLRAI